MGTYYVVEVGERGVKREPVEGLTAAKMQAESCARDSEHPVLVRDEAGNELARFAPGARMSGHHPVNPPSGTIRTKSSTPAPNPERKAPTLGNELATLKVAADRMKAVLESVANSKKKSS